MKKCSTAVFALSLALTFAAAPAHADERCAFLESAPERHTVAPGDTLWDIASTFLAHPWCWPEVWAWNRNEIRDPHWIYPGQVIVFDREAKRLTLSADSGGIRSLPLQQRAPTARSEPLREAPIPAVPPAWQRAAGELRLVASGSESAWPRILGFSESRRIAAAGDTALVDPGTADVRLVGQHRDVMRILRPVIDPENGRVLAVPLQQVGQAAFVRIAEQGLPLFKIVTTRGELLAGDLLAPPSAPMEATAEPLQLRPAPPFQGQVAAVLQGGRWAAQRDIVALNRGREAGLRAGHLVSVVRHVRIADHDASQRTQLRPAGASSKAIATLVVVETLEHVSLALVLRSEDAFSIGEQVRSVDRDTQ